jgi:hypothetical protein
MVCAHYVITRAHYVITRADYVHFVRRCSHYVNRRAHYVHYEHLRCAFYAHARQAHALECGRFLCLSRASTHTAVPQSPRVYAYGGAVGVARAHRRAYSKVGRAVGAREQLAMRQ